MGDDLNMDFSRKMPIGIQDFKDLREKNFVYVDKTQYAFKLANEGKMYFLSRPRRFGKSLFLSTLKAYFLGQKELFIGLYIEKAEEKRAKVEKTEAWIEYPVLYLDFNIGKYDEPHSLKSHLNLTLTQFEEIYGSHEQEKEPAQRFAGIIKRAYEKTGKQAVILVDEYDKPLLQTMGINETLNEEYRSTLKAFFSVIKTCDQYIRLAFLTGVTKFSKVSIFSDLNNLEDLSLQNYYSAVCGITEEELKNNFDFELRELAKQSDSKYDELLKYLKKHYDGYFFAREGKSVYNPFSILNVLKSKDFSNYWFSTGTPTFLVNYLKDAHYYVPDLDGNVDINETGLEAYRADAKTPIPILFQAGYLTIKEYIKEANLYRLGFPNDEVRYGFLQNLLPAFSDVGIDQAGTAVWRFVEEIRAGMVDEFMERMQSILAGIPYDNLTETNLKLREQNYQTAVYLIFKLMGQFTETEIHGSTGRADCIVHTKDFIYIFEFKLTGQGSAQDAITQIKEKAYAVPYMSSGKKIMAIGSSFDEEKRNIKDWQKEIL